ncbi:MAG: sulfite exporter TauE/SafE family protein [Methylococcales bacterium]|nr:sulfite exporter TauE/SafE family protein [Methylococcales bacterium]
MLEYWFVFPMAIVISTAASSVGIGGGVLLMPFFLIVLKLPPEIAVVTSLMTQTAGMGSASFTCYRQDRIDFRLAWLILAIAIPGVILGAYFVKFLEPNRIELILGLMVMTTAFVFVSSEQKYNDAGQSKVDMKKAYRHSWVTIPASIASGMLSISLSEWLIPVMRSKLSLSMSNSIGTCLFIALCVSLIGLSSHIVMGGNPSYDIVVWTIPGVLVGGQVGPRITKKINERLLKEAFIFLLTLVGIHLVYNAY